MSTEIKILHASCCTKSNKIKSQLEKLANENQLDLSIEEFSDMKDTMVYGTMIFPSIVVNGKVYDYKLYEEDSKLLAILK
ncbi:thioredoxin family protein [Aureivirga sp. CE67]|uniref:thioredoxin family protein n=1 Tax=Aureivirga sp. CE67 TaxID=1788983 RepID=UPI0018CA2CAA|nr:thioredoxin family protein [Aureivirga sp. CE67]